MAVDDANARFRNELTQLMKAQAPLVQIVSHEWERVEARIKQAIRAQNQPRRYLKWTHTDQLHEWDFEDQEWKKGDQLSEDLVQGAMKNGRNTLQWYLDCEINQPMKGGRLLSPEVSYNPLFFTLKMHTLFLKRDITTKWMI